MSGELRKLLEERGEPVELILGAEMGEALCNEAKDLGMAAVAMMFTVDEKQPELERFIVMTSMGLRPGKAVAQIFAGLRKVCRDYGFDYPALLEAELMDQQAATSKKPVPSAS